MLESVAVITIDDHIITKRTTFTYRYCHDLEGRPQYRGIAAIANEDFFYGRCVVATLTIIDLDQIC